MRRDPYRRADRLLIQAERKYDQPSYARALEAVEALPPDDPMTRFRRAAILHGLAELRGDARLLRRAREEYEALHPVVPRVVASLMPSLIEECREQERRAERRGR